MFTGRPRVCPATGAQHQIRSVRTPERIVDRQRKVLLFPAYWQGSTCQAMAIVPLAWLVASNAACLHASRSDSDATGLSRQLGQLPSPERVISEYPRSVVAACPATQTQVVYRSTPLETGERCAGGQVIHRLSNGWEGTNRPCNS